MEYLTTAQVAELKGCTPQYVRRLCQNGSINANIKASSANNRTEYEIELSELPEKLQIKWENKQRGELGLEPVRVTTKLAFVCTSVSFLSRYSLLCSLYYGIDVQKRGSSNDAPRL